MILLTGLIFRSLYGKRCDGNPNLKYFTHEDFEGLKAEPVEFPNKFGQTLRGNIYSRTEEPKALIVFSHGMFGGHLSYTRLINDLAENGYCVLGFDNTGTFSSDGNSLRGFYQSARDLKSALDFVTNKLTKYNSLPIVLMGHSWGAFATCQNLDYNNTNIKAAIAFSPPDLGYKAATGMIAPKLLKFNKIFLPGFLINDGIETLSSCSRVIKGSKTPLLILQGLKDQTVIPSCSPALNEEVRSKENVTIKLYENKAHNVYQTEESEKYMNESLAAVRKEKNIEKKKEMYKNIDWYLCTENDPVVMSDVYSFIESHI
ncbi:MAG: alpha/beta fold hydrolase [Oscillospiraceae bacterium]|nr:alpha/beta fold hydrolase [Oscillospiraceae bacterium]